MDVAAPALTPARLAAALAVYTPTHLVLTTVLLAVGSWDGPLAYAVFAVSVVTAAFVTRLALASEALTRLLQPA